MRRRGPPGLCRHTSGKRGEALDRLTRGFVPVLEGLAPSLSVPMSQHNADNVRFALLGMGTQHTDAGSLTVYPTGFVVAGGTDGVAVARNIAQADDLDAWDAPRDHVSGDSERAGGEPAAPGWGSWRPRRTSPRAATWSRPCRFTTRREPWWVLSRQGFRLGRSVARSIRRSEWNAGQEPVLWVGLRHNGRVFPSGRDRDVPERWLVPASLVTQIPPGADQQVESGRGEYVWQFVENGARGWAGGLGRLVQIQETDVLIFRSEASQN